MGAHHTIFNPSADEILEVSALAFSNAKKYAARHV